MQHMRHSELIDPRTDLAQAPIPQGGGYTNFDALRGCVVHWFSDCVLVSGGSQRTDVIASSSNAPGPSTSRRVGAPPSTAVDPSFSFVLVVSDSCVYVFDKSAVVIRCIPVAIIARLVVLELVARDTRSADAIRQNASRAPRGTAHQDEGGQALLLHAAHQLLGSSTANGAAAMTRSGVVPCFSIVGIAISPDQSAGKEHDLIIGVPLGATEELCGVLLRIHWAHLGPNTKLPVEAVDMTPIRHQRAAQAAAAPTSDGARDLNMVPTIADIFHGIDDAAVPPFFGLDTARSPNWELRVDPLRRWSQLEALLGKKHAMLVDEEVAIESAFRRIKSSLSEHCSTEQRDRWRLMAGQNQKLTDTVKALEVEVVIARRLLEQEVPGGLDLLNKLVAGGGVVAGPSLSAIDSISGNALFNPLDGESADDRRDFSSFFMSPIAPPSSQLQLNTLASAHAHSVTSFSRGFSSSSSLGGGGGPQKCTRCRELEFLVESHPNVDKVRILKAEEALITLQRRLVDAETHVLPLQQENAELRNVVSTMMRELVHASESETKLRRKQSTVAGGDDENAAARALHGKSFEVGVRNAIRTGEPYYRIEAPDAARSSTNAGSATLGDEVRQWRLLCSELERRHRQELKDLYNAFTMYDDIMSQAVHEALKHYEPTVNVNLAQATSNVISVAKNRAREAKAAASRAKRGVTTQAVDRSPAPQNDASAFQQPPLGTSFFAPVYGHGSATPPQTPQQWAGGPAALHQPSLYGYGGGGGGATSRQQVLTSGISPGPLDSMVRWAEI
jgi:hypothetical protein